jgi:hypothetical protein
MTYPKTTILITLHLDVGRHAGGVEDWTVHREKASAQEAS